MKIVSLICVVVSGLLFQSHALAEKLDCTDVDTRIGQTAAASGGMPAISDCAKVIEDAKNVCLKDISANKEELSSIQGVANGDDGSPTEVGADSSDPNQPKQTGGEHAAWAAEKKVHEFKNKKYSDKADLCRKQSENVKTTCKDYISAGQTGNPSKFVAALEHAGECNDKWAKQELSGAAYAGTQAKETGVLPDDPQDKFDPKAKSDPTDFKTSDYHDDKSLNKVNQVPDLTQEQRDHVEDLRGTVTDDGKEKDNHPYLDSLQTGLKLGEKIAPTGVAALDSGISVYRGNYGDAASTLGESATKSAVDATASAAYNYARPIVYDGVTGIVGTGGTAGVEGAVAGGGTSMAGTVIGGVLGGVVGGVVIVATNPTPAGGFGDAPLDDAAKITKAIKNIRP